MLPQPHIFTFTTVTSILCLGGQKVGEAGCHLLPFSSPAMPVNKGREAECVWVLAVSTSLGNLLLSVRERTASCGDVVKARKNVGEQVHRDRMWVAHRACHPTKEDSRQVQLSVCQVRAQSITCKVCMSVCVFASLYTLPSCFWLL